MSRRPVKYVRSVEQVVYHRNGVFGKPFHAVLFSTGTNRLLAHVGEAAGDVTILDVDAAARGNIGQNPMGGAANAWRGDIFEPELRQVVQERSTRPATPDEHAEAVRTHEFLSARARQHGLDPSWFGKSFTHETRLRGKVIRSTYKVVGMNLKRPKNCVRVETQRGRIAWCSPALVRRHLGGGGEAPPPSVPTTRRALDL